MIRRASGEDLVVLFDLEKRASTAALGHIFGADLPFPDDDVLARWRLVLDEPGMTVLIDSVGDLAVGFAAFGDGWLRHLGVDPLWWGTGRAAVLHDAALSALRSRGDSTAYLWVLVENRRARAFYERLGWTEAGPSEREVFEPYPEKMQMMRMLDGPVTQ